LPEMLFNFRFVNQNDKKKLLLIILNDRNNRLTTKRNIPKTLDTLSTSAVEIYKRQRQKVNTKNGVT
jgi:hypothetical protein